MINPSLVTLITILCLQNSLIIKKDYIALSRRITYQDYPFNELVAEKSFLKSKEKFKDQNYIKINFLKNITTISSKNSLEITQLKKENFSKASFKEFFLSLGLNFLSEIGDKSFICIILVYNQIPPFILFIVAAISEILMNSFSVFIGYKLRYLNTLKICCHFIGMIAAFVFSFIFIYEEFIQNKEIHQLGGEDINDGEMKNETIVCGGKKIRDQEEKTLQIGNVSLFVKVFKISWIIFLCEFGDRSQITTIILSSEYDPIPIFIGTALAHVLGIIISMTIGFLFAKNINKALISIIGAVCFFFFGAQLAVNFSNDGGFETLLGYK
jgi:putative Ca2+/H+ antiporter (TMEM165/GDT1 family)